MFAFIIKYKQLLKTNHSLYKSELLNILCIVRAPWFGGLE